MRKAATIAANTTVRVSVTLALRLRFWKSRRTPPRAVTSALSHPAVQAELRGAVPSGAHLQHGHARAAVAHGVEAHATGEAGEVVPGHRVAQPPARVGETLGEVALAQGA